MSFEAVKVSSSGLWSPSRMMYIWYQWDVANPKPQYAGDPVMKRTTFYHLSWLLSKWQVRFPSWLFHKDWKHPQLTRDMDFLFIVRPTCVTQFRLPKHNSSAGYIPHARRACQCRNEECNGNIQEYVAICQNYFGLDFGTGICATAKDLCLR